MFILSMKTSRPRILAGVAVAGLAVAAGLAAFPPAGTPGAVSASASVSVAATGEGCPEYLRSLGYEVLPGSGEVREVLIPAEFDDAFAAYNAIQQQAGTDLTPYRGKRVRLWTYTVTNYPGEDAVQAHVYVYKNTVIGGDVSSTAQGGFTQGLVPLTAPDAPDTTAHGQTG